MRPLVSPTRSLRPPGPQSFVACVLLLGGVGVACVGDFPSATFEVSAGDADTDAGNGGDAGPTPSPTDVGGADALGAGPGPDTDPRDGSVDPRPMPDAGAVPVDAAVCPVDPPRPEGCDQVDDDCDGRIDEGGVCECEPGAVAACGSDVGECVAGNQTCLPDGTLDACVGARGPTDEACDGLDNDCDARVDEGGAGPNCSLRLGVCDGARRRCEAVAADGPFCDAEDYGPSYAPNESGPCDALDNDCDGLVDEGCPDPGGLVGVWRVGGLLGDDPAIQTVVVDAEVEFDGAGSAVLRRLSTLAGDAVIGVGGAYDLDASGVLRIDWPEAVDPAGVARRWSGQLDVGGRVAVLHPETGAEPGAGLLLMLRASVPAAAAFRGRWTSTSLLGHGVGGAAAGDVAVVDLVEGAMDTWEVSRRARVDQAGRDAPDRGGTLRAVEGGGLELSAQEGEGVFAFRGAGDASGFAALVQWSGFGDAALPQPTLVPYLRTEGQLPEDGELRGLWRVIGVVAPDVQGEAWRAERYDLRFDGAGRYALQRPLDPAESGRPGRVTLPGGPSIRLLDDVGGRWLEGAVDVDAGRMLLWRMEGSPAEPDLATLEPSVYVAMRVRGVPAE